MRKRFLALILTLIMLAAGAMPVMAQGTQPRFPDQPTSAHCPYDTCVLYEWGEDHFGPQCIFDDACGWATYCPQCDNKFFVCPNCWQIIEVIQ